MPHKPKAATLPREAQAKAPPAATKPSRLLTVLVIASIAVVITGILLLKDQQQPAVAFSTAKGSTPAVATSNPAAVNGPFKPSSPSAQLDQALATGQPVLVFMHSNNCRSCIDMMKVVDEVYPEFTGQIALVDVDVYDEANAALMERLGLRYIPTVVVFGSEGQASQNVGGMDPVAFRTFLRERGLGS